MTRRPPFLLPSTLLPPARLLSALVLPGLLLAACVSGPIPVAYRAGSFGAERQRAADACRIQSLSRIPQALVTEVTPGHYSPGFIQCEERDGRQICREIGGMDYPPVYRTRDVNADLRRRDVANCLQSQGYAVISRPVCSDSAARLLPPDMPQPKDSDIACVKEDETLFPDGW